MLGIFTKFADWATVMLGLDAATRLGGAVHFFIEDVSKIFVLIYVLIFVISLFRSQLSPQRVQQYLSGKNRWYGYSLAVLLGVVTPFCSCSSIPLFIGFVSAGVPFGMAMAFLISSPLVSEIAAVLLLGLEGAGPLVAGLYVLSGMSIAFLGGWLCDKLHLERWALYAKPVISAPKACCCGGIKQRGKVLLRYAHQYAWDTLKSIGLYVLLGLAVGAFIHGFVPQEMLLVLLGRENALGVVWAALIGVPLYANHAGVIPIIQALLIKGVPVGTALAMLMSITAISLPEMIMLKKILAWKMILIFAGYLFVAFVGVGYLLNWVL